MRLTQTTANSDYLVKVLTDYQVKTGISDKDLAKKIGFNDLSIIAKWKAGEKKAYTCSVLKGLLVLLGADANDLRDTSVPHISHKKLAAFRRYLGVPVEAMAAKLFVTPDHYPSYEDGTSHPKAVFRYVLMRFADDLGYSFTDPPRQHPKTIKEQQARIRVRLRAYRDLTGAPKSEIAEILKGPLKPKTIAHWFNAGGPCLRSCEPLMPSSRFRNRSPRWSTT